MKDLNNMYASSVRYNHGREKDEVASRNIETFRAILSTLAIDDKTEVPLDTILSMYSLFDNMEHGMCKDELEFRLDILAITRYIDIRTTPYGTKMVSITDLGYEKYSGVDKNYSRLLFHKEEEV